MSLTRVSEWPVSSGSLVLPKTTNTGLKVDQTTPTWGWRDITGPIKPKASGSGAPTLNVFRAGQIREYSFIVNDLIEFDFHIPHDYVPGTDLYWHLHWSHNGTTISGTFSVDNYATYVKGHNQGSFPAEKVTSISYSTVNITTTPRYIHRIDEIQLSTSGGSSTLLDTDNIEVDGLLLIACKVTAIPTIGNGSPNAPFILFGDLHYQSSNMSTKNKAPNFYS